MLDSRQVPRMIACATLGADSERASSARVCFAISPRKCPRAVPGAERAGHSMAALRGDDSDGGCAPQVDQQVCVCVDSARNMYASLWDADARSASADEDGGGQRKSNATPADLGADSRIVSVFPLMCPPYMCASLFCVERIGFALPICFTL
eukprot:2268257-Rhodomonas_salina.1